MTASSDILQELTAHRLKRRSMIKGASLAAAGIAAGSVAGLDRAQAAAPITLVVADADVLNFALNLEYLEANYYLLGVSGTPLPSTLTGGGPTPMYKSTSTLVPFQTEELAYYFQRIAADEYTHVAFLRDALGDAAVAQPNIDLMTSFTTLAQAAMLVPSNASFDPFESEIAFLIGSYIFEDVGVTAYAGGAAYLQNAANLSYAASVLAIEGYHAGAIRGYLASRGGGAVTNAISALRATLSGAKDDNGTDIAGGNPFSIVNADYNGQAFRRSFNQVLSIVYGNSTVGTGGGLFFPSGLSGNITNNGSTYTPYVNVNV